MQFDKALEVIPSLDMSFKNPHLGYEAYLFCLPEAGTTTRGAMLGKPSLHFRILSSNFWTTSFIPKNSSFFPLNYTSMSHTWATFFPFVASSDKSIVISSKSYKALCV